MSKLNTLLARKGSYAFIIAVFLNAFIDLGHKIVIQNTIFKIYDGAELVILSAVINALILLPFILLFSPSSYVSDKYPKHKVMQASALAAVILTLGIMLCYAMAWFKGAFAMTFLLAAQSAFYSPAKMAYIRGFFGKENLAQANGIISATSIIAILSGTLVFSVIFESLFVDTMKTEADIIQNLVPIAVILFANSLIETFLVYRLPKVENDLDNNSEVFPTKQYLKGQLVTKNLKPILSNQSIFLSIIGLAMFWSIGQVMLAAFPAFLKQQTGEINTIVVQAIIASSGLGIAFGAYVAGKISRHYIETGLVPIGAAGIALGLFFLPNLENQVLMGLDFLFIGIMGGLFIVPLNALIQFHANQNELGKVLAGNNLIQNIAMLSFLILTVSFALADIESKNLLILISFVAIAGGLYTVKKLPQSLIMLMLAGTMKRRYKLNVEGLDHMPNKGGLLLLGNHTSWIDWAILQLASPRPLRFVMEKKIYEQWYLTWFFSLFGAVPIQAGAGSKKSLSIIAALLDKGEVVCLFPEGVISRTGHLAEFKRGFERAIEQTETDVKIMPFYLRGLWGSTFSRSSDKLKKQSGSSWKRNIVVAFGKPIEKTATVDIVKRKVFDLSVSSWQSHVETLPSLAQAWIDAVKRKSSGLAVADSLSPDLTNQQLLSIAIAFSKRIKTLSPENNIGLIVPTSAGGVIANMATLLLGKTIINLNYTASESAMDSAIKQAEIKTIYTSKRFIKKLKTRGVDISRLEEQCKLVFLEDLRTEISKAELLKNMILVKLLPASLLKLVYCKKQSLDSIAAILFSSGSEGEPKGVKLSNKNFMANLKQISDVLNTQDSDVIMASLPLFHAFGLTVTQFLPLIEGLPMICHADPTDVVGISKAVASHKVTVMCGTSTFLRLYCRNNKVHPLMLDSLRIVISGAEKLNPNVREAFKFKFNKDILEGYGATETTPVASVNLPDSLDTSYWKVQVGGKQGTVGMPLPGTSFKIVDPSTWQELETGEDGMILIGGAQVMQGYLNNPEKTESVIQYIDEQRWYVTGDKGHVDADGFLSIVDRYSRFAKLGGEMVSLSAVEGTIQNALNKQHPDIEVVAVNIPDDKKGEKIVILAELNITLSDLKSALIAQNCNGLMIPSQLIQVDALPKLGTGKTDFTQAKAIVSNQA